MAKAVANDGVFGQSNLVVVGGKQCQNQLISETDGKECHLVAIDGVFGHFATDSHCWCPVANDVKQVPLLPPIAILGVEWQTV
jgi:hypothetical protein